MRVLTHRRAGLWLLILAVGLLPGCIKEKYVVTVYPDGSGKVEVTMGANAALSSLMEAGGESGRGSGVPTADSIKSNSTGFVAWTDSMAFRSGEFTMSKVVGYFTDINQVEIRSGTAENEIATTFSFKERSDGRYELSAFQVGDVAQFEDENPFDDARTDAEKEMVRNTLRATMAGFETWSVYKLPGEVVDATGLTRSGRTAEFKVDLEKLIEILETGKEPAEMKRRSMICKPMAGLEEEIALFQREMEKVQAGVGEPLTGPVGGHDDGHDHGGDSDHDADSGSGGDSGGTSSGAGRVVAPPPPSPAALEMLPHFVRYQARTMVFSDGSGKVTLRIGAPEGKPAIDPDVIRASSEGIVAWSEPKSFSLRGAHITRLTGYFDDLNAVRLRSTTDDTRETTFRFSKIESSGYLVTVADSHLAMTTADGTNPLGRGLDWQAKNNFRSTMKRALKDFEMAFSVRMPGAANEAKGIEIDHRRASFEVDLDDYFDVLISPPEDGAPISMTISSGPDADDLEPDRQAFLQEYEAAKAAWAEMQKEG